MCIMFYVSESWPCPCQVGSTDEREEISGYTSSLRWTVSPDIVFQERASSSSLLSAPHCANLYKAAGPYIPTEYGINKRLLRISREAIGGGFKLLYTCVCVFAVDDVSRCRGRLKPDLILRSVPFTLQISFRRSWHVDDSSSDTSEGDWVRTIRIHRVVQINSNFWEYLDKNRVEKRARDCCNKGNQTWNKYMFSAWICCVFCFCEK